MTQLTTDELLKVLHTALEVFRAEVDPDLLVTKVLTLTATARNTGLQQVDVPLHVKGLTTSATSRHVMDWSELDKNKQAGMDFIQQRQDPAYRRRNLLYVTPKGHQFLHRVTTAVNRALGGSKMPTAY